MKKISTLLPAFAIAASLACSAANEWDKAKGDKVFSDLLASDSPTARHPFVLDFKRKMDEADAMRASIPSRPSRTTC